MLIVDSYGAAGAWDAWLSLNRKFGKTGGEEIWGLLRVDEMHQQHLSWQHAPPKLSHQYGRIPDENTFSLPAASLGTQLLRAGD